MAKLNAEISFRSDTQDLDSTIAKVEKLVALLKELKGLAKAEDNSLFCLCQHFAVWYEAIKQDSHPDFSAPCENCRNQEDCRQKGYPWMDKILPVLDAQGIRINLVHRQSK